MSQLNDCRFDSLVAQGFSGTTNDMLLDWLQSNGVSAVQLNDAWYEFLVAQGMTVATYNDMKFEWLGSLGFTGALNDREAGFWCGGGVVGPGVTRAYIPDDDRAHIHVIFNGAVAGTLNLGVTYTVDGGAPTAFLSGISLGSNHVQYALQVADAPAAADKVYRWIYAPGDLTVGGEVLPDQNKLVDNQIAPVIVITGIVVNQVEVPI